MKKTPLSDQREGRFLLPIAGVNMQSDILVLSFSTFYLLYL